MAAELLALVLRLSLCLGAATLVVMALRLPARRLAGARLAYGLWLLVPLVGLSALVPLSGPPVIDPLAVARAIAPPPPVAAYPTSSAAAAETPAPAAVLVRPVASAVAAPARPAPALALDHGPVWVIVWAAGALILMLRILRLQSRFIAGLGRLEPDPALKGVYHSAGSEGPAVVGLLRVRIVLPTGFSSRYEAGEQVLILAHERVHQRARHPVANALGAALLCLQWFNPLAHLALRMMRLDQELACDAAVIAEHPGQGGDYARAMLKTGAMHPALPLACAWPAAGKGALKQRIALLRAPPPGPWRRRFMGLALLATVSTGTIAFQGTGLASSRAEAAVIQAMTLDFTAVDAQVKSLTLPPRPPEPLITDAKVWTQRAAAAGDEAHLARRLATGALRGRTALFWAPRRPYMARQAQHFEVQQAAARRAATAATRLTLPIGQASARENLQAAQDAYRAAQDQVLALKVAMNHYLGDQYEELSRLPLPDNNNLTLLRDRAQALLARPDTAKAAQTLIDAIDAEQPLRDQAGAAAKAMVTSDLMVVGYDYEALDPALLDSARDPWFPAWLVSREASLRSMGASMVRGRAQRALAALSPTIPVGFEPPIPFVRQQALTVRRMKQERGFILGRPHPDPMLVVQFNSAIARMAAIPDPFPGEIDLWRQPRTARERAGWDNPYPHGSPYGADPGIAFLEERIKTVSAQANPDGTVIAALRERLAALKAGKAPTV